MIRKRKAALLGPGSDVRPDAARPIARSPEKIMIELFFVACLQASPAACEERTIVYQESVGMMACVMLAQPELARWSEAHPGVEIARWSCRPAGDDA